MLSVFNHLVNFENSYLFCYKFFLVNFTASHQKVDTVVNVLK